MVFCHFICAAAKCLYLNFLRLYGWRYAPFVLGERLTLIRFMAAAMGFFGILVVARPDFSDINPAIIAAALCAIGFAGATLTTKILTEQRPSPPFCFG